MRTMVGAVEARAFFGVDGSHSGRTSSSSVARSAEKAAWYCGRMERIVLITPSAPMQRGDVARKKMWFDSVIW